MDTLLVYWGTPNIGKSYIIVLHHFVHPSSLRSPLLWTERYLPGDRAAINMHDFATPDELAALLRTLWDNEDLYRSFFEWRQPGA